MAWSIIEYWVKYLKLRINSAIYVSVPTVIFNKLEILNNDMFLTE